MIGAFTPRALGLAAVASLWLAAGVALARPEIALVGALLLAALSAWRVAAIVRAAELLGGELEVGWGLARTDAGALRAGESFDLRVRARMRRRGSPDGVRGRPGRRGVRLRVAIDGSPGIAVRAVTVSVWPGAEIEAMARGRAVATGRWHLGGVALEITCALGLVTHEARVRGRVAFDVLPRARTRRSPSSLSADHTLKGARLPRRLGDSVDLRELRPWTPGDPFRLIAWKATSRAWGRAGAGGIGTPPMARLPAALIVRQFEGEARARCHLALDIGPDMRAGVVGEQALDDAIAEALALARAALDTGDPVGLSTLDGRVVTHAPPATGRRQEARLLRTLLDCRRPADEDLTDATDGELVAAAAAYLRLERGVDARHAPPPPLDPSWAHIKVGPDGAAYDLRAIVAAARDDLLRDAPRRAGAPLPRASSKAMAIVRALAQARGFDLAPRRSGSPARRTASLVALLRAAAPWRSPHQLVLLCGSTDITPDADLERIARHVLRRHRLVVVARARTPAGDRLLLSLGAKIALPRARTIVPR
ncbi:MAG: DUF58 domain-containing protein [Myxococcota bacterium]